MVDTCWFNVARVMSPQLGQAVGSLFPPTYPIPPESISSTSVNSTETNGEMVQGEVYKAKDLKPGRDVAIKVLREELSSDPERLRRFEQEARSASALNRPNIITIHDIGKHEATPSCAKTRPTGIVCYTEKVAPHGLHGQ